MDGAGVPATTAYNQLVNTMSTHRASSALLPTGSAWKRESVFPTSAIVDKNTVVITDYDLAKLKESTRIHAESLNLLGQ